jgi:hypothetical protein
MNIFMFKFCCNIFIGVRIIKEMLGSVVSGTHCIKMDLQEVGCGGMDWMKGAHDRDRWQALVNVVMNL